MLETNSQCSSPTGKENFLQKLSESPFSSPTLVVASTHMLVSFSTPTLRVEDCEVFFFSLNLSLFSQVDYFESV